MVLIRGSTLVFIAVPQPLSEVSVQLVYNQEAELTEISVQWREQVCNNNSFKKISFLTYI